jgi:hypothetical protein
VGDKPKPEAPGTLLVQARAARQEGRAEEADALYQEYERQAGDAEEKRRIRRYKADRDARNEPVVLIDPETDPVFVRCVTALDHGGTKLTLTYLDPGPHPRGTRADKGWENYPALNIERWMTDIATKHPAVTITPDYTREVSERLEGWYDGRINKVHNRVHRGLNHLEWLGLVAKHGLGNAREMKRKIGWWLVRHVPAMGAAVVAGEPAAVGGLDDPRFPVATETPADTGTGANDDESDTGSATETTGVPATEGFEPEFVGTTPDTVDSDTAQEVR